MIQRCYSSTAVFAPPHVVKRSSSGSKGGGVTSGKGGGVVSGKGGGVASGKGGGVTSGKPGIYPFNKYLL